MHGIHLQVLAGREDCGTKGWSSHSQSEVNQVPLRHPLSFKQYLFSFIHCFRTNLIKRTNCNRRIKIEQKLTSFCLSLNQKLILTNWVTSYTLCWRNKIWTPLTFDCLLLKTDKELFMMSNEKKGEREKETLEEKGVTASSLHLLQSSFILRYQ